eukprot:COSAG01_NODE_33476_length_563_cov_1.293103_1_plen_162_part_10
MYVCSPPAAHVGCGGRPEVEAPLRDTPVISAVPWFFHCSPAGPGSGTGPATALRIFDLPTYAEAAERLRCMCNRHTATVSRYSCLRRCGGYCASWAAPCAWSCVQCCALTSAPSYPRLSRHRSVEAARGRTDLSRARSRPPQHRCDSRAEMRSGHRKCCLFL